jgi:hypothetical protein
MDVRVGKVLNGLWMVACAAFVLLALSGMRHWQQFVSMAAALGAPIGGVLAGKAVRRARQTSKASPPSPPEFP